MEENTPINATEIFGVSQMIALCELHEKVARDVNMRPILYMSHIAGIYDDYFKSYAEKEKVDISPDVLWQAGLAVARRVYQVMEERGYSAIFVGGGARAASLHRNGGRQSVHDDQLGRHGRQIDRSRSSSHFPALQPGAAKGDR